MRKILEIKSKETDLFIISIVVILFELIAIRWIGSNIKVVAYFSNLILISCFLGLGWGYLTSKSSIRLRYLFPIFLLVFILSILLLRQFNLISVDPSHHLHVYTYKDIPVAKKINFFLIVSLVFIINTIAFIPLGQIVGRLFSLFEKPLIAYSINIAGNIIGALLFIALSFLWTPPLVWFSCLVLLFLWFLKEKKKTLIYGLIVFAICLLSLEREEKKEIEYWSPYYHVSLDPIPSHSNGNNLGYVLNVDGERHQDSLDFMNHSFIDSWYGWWNDFYEIPYLFGKPKKLLILGAGSGNDTYFALKNDVDEICAVEIDPAIIKIGRERHPQKPYAYQNRVTVFNDDARSFLTNNKEKYDMIIFGVLDSHKLASYIAVGLRLDNFLYTVECFKLVKDHLKENGILVLQHGGHPWVIARIYNALKEAFGKAPHVYQLKTAPWPILNYVLSAGELMPFPSSSHNLIEYSGFDKFASPFGCLYDDWPFLYLESRRIPKNYMQVMFFIIIFSAIGVLLRFKKHIRLLPWQNSIHFFVMGVAFLLLETANISRTAILFGCTWLTTSAIIVIILLYILIANIIATKIKIPSLRFYYFFLFLSLILCYFIPMAQILRYPLMVRLGIGAFLLGLPILFSAVIFATTFKVQRHPEVILGINLLGAVIGGLLEYIDLILGMKSLYAVALCLYLISFCSLSMGRRSQTT